MAQRQRRPAAGGASAYVSLQRDKAAPPYLNLGNKKAPDCSGALMKTN
jgi:hypothetical protein